MVVSMVAMMVAMKVFRMADSMVAYLVLCSVETLVAKLVDK
jgi:hypothetical protein